VNPILASFPLILIAAGVICVGIAIYVWLQPRNNSETIPLVPILLGITEWIAIVPTSFPSHPYGDLTLAACADCFFDKTCDIEPPISAF
jgi:hypothetical protein